MTYPGDPNTPRRPGDYIDRAPSSSTAAPVVGGLAVLAVIVVLIFSFADRHPSPTTNTSGTSVQPKTTAPAPTTPPATKPQ
jgi:hypothetical protein